MSEKVKIKKKKSLAGKIVGYFFLGLLALIIIIAAITGIKWAVHKKAPASYGSYTWSKDMPFDLDTFRGQDLRIDANAESLKIMQIADPQIKFGNITSDTKTMDLLDRALKEEKPDIAVCTGDLTCSIYTYDAYKYFADFMEARGQYWTLAYGNHDSQFDSSKYSIYTLLSEYKYCLFDKGPNNIKGESNFLVNVYKGDATIPSYSLIMLDSNMYPEGTDGGLASWVYDWIGEDQIEWYKWAVNGLRSLSPTIETSLFYHMPIREFADMYYSYQLQEGNVIPEQIDASTLKPVTNFSGYVQEVDKDPSETMDDGYTVGIYYQGKNTGLFDVVKELGCTKAMFVGHDHVNNMKGTYDGVYLAYGLCCGYHTYPFFQNNFFLLDWIGLSDDVTYNGELWVDAEGNRMEKGVTVIEIGLGSSNYGNITAIDKGDSQYK